MKVAQKLLGVPTIGGGSARAGADWWRELKEEISPQQAEYTKTVQKTGTFWLKNCRKRCFFAQKYLIRYTPKIFLRIH
jgi:hypothetical protein